MKTKTLILPLSRGKVRVDIDIYGRSECFLEEEGGPRYLGTGLIENISHNLISAMQCDREERKVAKGGKSLWRVIALAGTHYMLYVECQNGEKTLYFFDEAETVIARKTLSLSDYDKWLEELQK